MLVILSGFGGGFLSPVFIGKPIMPAVNDAILPVCILAWYMTHYLNLQPFLTWKPVKVLWTVFLALFRTHSVCNAVRNAMTVLKPGPYYPIPLMGPIICGTTVGSMGQFIPLDKGFTPISNGTPWPIQGAFLSAIFYHLVVYDQEGFLGKSLRAVIGNLTEEDARVVIATMQLIQLVSQVIIHPEFNIFKPIHKLLYFLVDVQGPKEAKNDKDKTEPNALELVYRVLKLLVLFALGCGYFVWMQPPSVLSINKPLMVGERIATCQYFGEILNCQPRELRFEYTASSNNPNISALPEPSFRLASYLSKSSDPCWTYIMNVNSTTAGVFNNVNVDVAFILEASGVPEVVSIDRATKVQQLLWKSESLCQNSDGNQARRIEIAEDGAAVINCGSHHKNKLHQEEL